jgi:hypothetical protein
MERKFERIVKGVGVYQFYPDAYRQANVERFQVGSVSDGA